MSNKLCRRAIETQLSAWAAARAPALQVAFENVPFTPPAGAYLRGFLLPARTSSQDLAGAHREYSGVYQVSVVAPLNAGPGAAEGIADELATLFPLNQRIAVPGLTLQIVTPVTAAQGAPDSVSFIVPVSFEYRADTI
ncbi:phage tail terminator-like protein [Dyella kyungheensis]|uniref:phage tail terminator-like protein n=1 Tax=Dyella kyungheensis TaxID=1242174 RepID=UPI003CF70871